ncbi:EexN family lipoprotein, partial [Escherichia coli]|nr:EexN family lipoprotein [Escherichia coli]
MKLKTLTFIVLASVAALTGCEDKTSVDWYMAHHDDMLAKYRE